MLVYMFPGQGSQKVGMGEGLFEKYPELIEKADKILGYSIKKLCLEDTDGVINNTAYTQPALFTVNAMMYEEAKTEFGAPAYCIGHSLGEYSALYASGSFDFETGVKLVQKRGEIMSKSDNGAMAAVLGMNIDDVKKTLASNSVGEAIDLANINSDIQVVISGTKDAIASGEALFKDNGAKRYMVLPVSGAFHSRYMKDAQAEFEKFISDFEIKTPTIPVIANATASEYKDEIKTILVSQISSSVRWVEIVQGLKAKGEVDFKEVGPGSVLTGLVRKIS